MGRNELSKMTVAKLKEQGFKVKAGRPVVKYEAFIAPGEDTTTWNYNPRKHVCYVNVNYYGIEGVVQGVCLTDIDGIEFVELFGDYEIKCK